LTFNINRGQPNGGPGSEFRAEPNSPQTHKLLSRSRPTPEILRYGLSVYDNADFPAVRDRATASKAKMVAPGVATVNVSVEP